LNIRFKEIYQKIEKTIERLPSVIDEKSRRLFYFVFLIIYPTWDFSGMMKDTGTD